MVKIQSIVSEEKFFKEKVYGRTHGRTDARRPHAMTIARWPSASGAKNLMVFDDLLLENQNKCESYYVRGRHSNVDCFYLAQNYFKLPRQTIRENANLICLFPQDLKNINHIYSDHVGDDMKKEEFRRFCKNSRDGTPYGFAVIDLTSKKDSGKYRSGFDNFFIS